MQQNTEIKSNLYTFILWYTFKLWLNKNKFGELKLMKNILPAQPMAIVQNSFSMSMNLVLFSSDDPHKAAIIQV